MKQMKAWCDEPGHVVMQPFESGGPQIGLTVDLAGELHKHLGLAIEEAKRRADLFEKWWGSGSDSINIGRSYISKVAARQIWEAAAAATAKQP